MTDSRTQVEVYTDGACSPNPGPGGWGALLVRDTGEQELCGGQTASTTNNRMELMAPIAALESLPPGSVVRLYTDSSYVRDGITRWMLRWKVNGWQTAGRQPVKNVDLWRRLDAAVRRHDVRWHWVKGHAGNPGNERADRLAARGMAQALADPAGSTPAREPAARAAPADDVSPTRGRSSPAATDEPWPTLF